ncbi:protoheme IX farnesyltransferase [Chloroflexota bacterium]
MNQATEAVRSKITVDPSGQPIYIWLVDYIRVLKPRETALLIYIGICSAIIAGQGSVPLDVLFLALAAIGTGSSGANGLTNYLDRKLDAKMERTKQRVLPTMRIAPSEKALLWSIALIIVGLIMAWFLHPLCFLFGLVGTVAASVWRKRVMCVIQGGFAGCAPVLIGYVAVNHRLDLPILFLCLLIIVWIPLHVWSVMVASRDDYLQAGIVYFPITWKVSDSIKILLGLSVLLYAASIALWAIGDFGWLYFAIANIMGIIMIIANWLLLGSGLSRDAWKVYKLSSFPYLGVIFMVLCLDFWV